MEEESSSDEYEDDSDEDSGLSKPPPAIGKPVMAVGKNKTKPICICLCYNLIVLKILLCIPF
jgi:hypothetical protein